MLKIPDLFTTGGIYWFYKGWNLRCMIALILGMLPSLPGFFYTCIDSSTQNAAVSIFEVCYFVGAPISFLIYYGLNYFWPPEGLGERELISPETEGVEVIDSTGYSHDNSTPEKVSVSADITEKDSAQL